MAKAGQYEYEVVAHNGFPRFPVPFGGINIRIKAESESGLASMIRAIQRCGHGHNFAVEKDVPTREVGALWTTQTGAYCASNGQLGSES